MKLEENETRERIIRDFFFLLLFSLAFSVTRPKRKSMTYLALKKKQNAKEERVNHSVVRICKQNSYEKFHLLGRLACIFCSTRCTSHESLANSSEKEKITCDDAEIFFSFLIRPQFRRSSSQCSHNCARKCYQCMKFF